MLEIEGLAYSRGDFELSLSLSLPAGAYGILLGPSGSGKSTALRLIAGLLQARAGSIRLFGRELSGLAPEARRVGMVFQDYALFPQLSVRRNIEYGPRLKGLSRGEARSLAEDLARALRIEALLERPPARLSGGEAQRVALARSLAARPELLLLDEPLSSLDPGLRQALRKELGARIREFGLSALHVTHDLEEALALGDRIFLMNRGRIEESGSPEELFERPRSAFAAAFMGRGILIPLDSTPRAGEAARSPWGEFRFAAEADQGRLKSGAGQAGKVFLFLPSSQAILLSASESCPENLLSGRVLGTGYRGDTRELYLEAEPREPGQPTLPLRLQLPAELRPREGEVLRFRLPPELCRIVVG